MYRSSRNLCRKFIEKSNTTYQIRKYVRTTMLKIKNGPQITHLRKIHEIPDLTKDRYPHVKRGDFNNLTQDHIRFFKSILGETRVFTEESDVANYNMDWLRTVRGFSNAVLKPKTTEEVSAILKYCNDNKLAVCPQGGNTGLVGGSVPVFDEVVLSTGLMNQIIHLDELSGVLTCQSGCILENLDTYLKNYELMMPLDLGAKGSCQIGGNISTNAGGIRLVRYGSLQGTVRGLEVVLANGEILDLLSTLKKDNTGYHLKHLFIGSEGTLGVVTKVAIQCPPAPKAVNMAFLGLNSFQEILKAFQSARSNLGEILSSCEVIDHLSLDVALRHLNVKNPLSQDYPFYLLIETSGGKGEHDQDKLNSFLEKILESGVVKDGTMTSDPSKMNHLWELRERIAECLMRDGYVYKYDISLPLNNYYELVEVMRERLKGTKAKFVSGYGHLGDGNLHLNITSEKYEKDLINHIEPFIFEWTHKLRGSVSAEHGIGFKKTQFLHFSKSQSSINVMKDIKKLLDPNGILNPYKVLPQ